MNVRLIHITPNSERLIAYCARVSSPNQDNSEYEKLINYCIKHKHWSIFEMANLCIEIKTSRAIAQQILRHKSFSFQEFSQRFSDNLDFEFYEARKQDTKNRQGGTKSVNDETDKWFLEAQERVVHQSINLYHQAIEKGIARECARFLLPLSTITKIYMNGSVRSWVHYILLRTEENTQKEHRNIANDCKRIFVEQLPTISKALGWINP